MTFDVYGNERGLSMPDLPGLPWPPEFAAAGMHLLRAADFAESLQRSNWDFAVEQAELRHLGLSGPDLRWLVCLELIEHARELTSSRSRARAFETTGQLSFTDQTCFILTPTGRSAILHLNSTSHPPRDTTIPHKTPSLNEHESDVKSGVERPSFPTDEKGSPSVSSSSARDLQGLKSNVLPTVQNSQSTDARDIGGNGNGVAPHRLVSLKPVWDKDLNRLTLGDVLVKEYKTPAPNQQLILSVFQEEGWPSRIDDPLPPAPDLDPKRRLHETIISLNRNQRNRVLKFCGDGNGLGVRWITSSQAVCD